MARGRADRRPTETQLAKKFGISRLSVRKVTKSLEFLGILESKTGVGLTVGRINMERVFRWTVLPDFWTLPAGQAFTPSHYYNRTPS